MFYILFAVFILANLFLQYCIQLSVSHEKIWLKVTVSFHRLLMEVTKKLFGFESIILNTNL